MFLDVKTINKEILRIFLRYLSIIIIKKRIVITYLFIN